MAESNELLAEYLEARTARDKAQHDLDMIQARLVKQMEAEQRKTYRWTDGDLSRTVTYVQKRVPVIDEVGLRKALTAKVFDRYTKRTLDKRAMEAAMDEGKIDPVTVSRFVTMKPNKPYLELREREATTNTEQEIA